VSFPNPEEPGALDRALALAKATSADLVLANDPDADRLAAAVPSGDTYRLLTGNEVGWLLADEALSHSKGPSLVITTIVSSTLLSRMARDRGATYEETLTGFKWIADAARRAAARGETPVFGYEEALGYMCGSLVPDKDGISAAVRLAELARALEAEGKTLLSRLDEILVAHGMSHQAQWSVTRPGLAGKAELERAMTALRQAPLESLGASPVVRVADFASAQARDAEGRVTPLGLPQADVLSFFAADGSRLVVRPSGTEPKVKFYLELVTRVDSTAAVAAARQKLDAVAATIRSSVSARLGLA
jgi:phosphomannomutase